jgi:gluconokinase
MILVVMGVTGSGKTVVGSALAQALGWPFLDGDDFHPPANVAKMASGTRDRLAACAKAPDDVRFVYLKGDFDTIAARLAARKHRYMPASLLASQFATLEEPADAIVVDASATIADEVARIRECLLAELEKR